MSTRTRLAPAAALLAFAAVAVPAPSSPADTIWDEAVHGDLSNDRLAPTPLTLTPGTHSLFATSVSGDREYLACTIPAGAQLARLILVSYAGLDGTAFAAVQAGPTLTEPPQGTNVANLLGWSHFGPGAGNLGSDILDGMGAGPGAIGFTPPLPSGVFTFWLQQTGPNASTYQFDFVVTPSPGPAAVLLALPLALARRPRRPA